MKILIIIEQVIVHLVFLKAVIIGSNYDFINKRYR